MSDLKQAKCRIMELEQENGRLKKRNRDAYSARKEIKGELETIKLKCKQANESADITRQKGATMYVYVKWLTDRLHSIEGQDGQSLEDYDKALQGEFNERER